VPEKLKVAESLQEYRRNHLYNRYDTNVQRFSAEVPQIWQWDDHEVTNNWSDSKVLASPPYTEQRIQTLVSRATRAFLEYSPMRWHNQAESERVYRHIPYNRDLDVLVLDERSYRGPNTFNRKNSVATRRHSSGARSSRVLKTKLQDSRATWKIIASDMPIGLQWATASTRKAARVGKRSRTATGRCSDASSSSPRSCASSSARTFATSCGSPRRALLRRALLRPSRAQFQDFDPFWEFVAGPLHAGSFGPNLLDNTFGPQVVFQKAPPVANTPPSGGSSSSADRSRLAQQASDRVAEGHQRHDGVLEAARCTAVERRKVGLRRSLAKSQSQTSRVLNIQTRNLGAFAAWRESLLRCAQCALTRNSTLPRRSPATPLIDRTTRAGPRKYSFPSIAPSGIGIENHTPRAVFARAARVASRIFLQYTSVGDTQSDHGGAKNEVSSTSAQISSICIAWTHDTARATDCERRLLGDVERDGCLYRRHDRQLERHRVQGELVDAGRQPFDPQRRAGQRPAVDEPR
jgi:hypothetical protein